VLGLILAFFTGGASLIAEAANIAEKQAVFFKLLVQEIISTATMGLVDILRLFKILIAKFALACKNGWAGFKKFLENLLGNKADDVLAEEGKVLDDITNDEKLLELLKNLQKGGGDINKTFAENAGIIIERFISKAKVIGQTTDNTCAATSLRMILDDIGIIRTEDELARVLKTDANGASILDIPEALYQKRLDDAVTAIAEKDIKLSKLIENLKEGDKAIVSVFKKEFGSHAVVLEKVENGKVFLRDPLPRNRGASYSMSIENFQRIFNKKAVIIKK
jgi:predicted double-glycine peptidase